MGAAPNGNAKSAVGLLQSYVPQVGTYDENLDGQGHLRPQWRGLDGWLAESSPEGMSRRVTQIRRMTHQNGIAYSAYGDASAREQHLRLDPLPQLVSATEWRSIEQGLIQRATLLNKLLADLYGPQTLLKDGTLPPRLLFDHPHYQLPFHDLPPAGGQHLHIYAAELARSPSGKCWVMVDRTDAPGGTGFALENRIVISRALPSEFRRSNVQRLAPYFIALREHLAGLAGRNKDNPHIAILSAGTGSASYFEDAYMARYLGFTLVEAADLVVRKSRVMLKTLSGLVPIDVILRRQHSSHLDPLELGGSSPGIAGILQVVRDGNVAIASAPGSGLVESPIFMAFMPRICQALLQTDLLLPGVATWWGGDKPSLEIMLDNIDNLSLFPAFRRRSFLSRTDRNPADAESLTREERIILVRKNPGGWVGQEKVVRSSAAVWEDGVLQSRHLSMRAFLVASGDSYHVMNGGLSRTSESPDALNFKTVIGGGTKDAWILSDQPVEPVSLLQQSGDPIQAVRGSRYISSRLADNFSWLGRYLERADATARLLRAVVTRLTSEEDPTASRELPLLVRALAAEGLIDPGFAIDEIRKQLPEIERAIVSSTLDRTEPGTLRNLIDQIHFLASKVRERLSPDVWRTVRKISESFEATEAETCDLAELLNITNELIVDMAAFIGLIGESMTRTHAFGFLNLGRRIERSLQIVSLVRNCFSREELVSTDLLEAVLEVADSIMTYRSRYYANLQMSAVLDLLLSDESNPRSLAFQLHQLKLNVDSLPGNQKLTEFSKGQRLAMDALHTVRMAEITELCELHSLGEPHHLFEMLDQIKEQLPEIATAVSNRFLVHTGKVSQLISDEFIRP